MAGFCRDVFVSGNYLLRRIQKNEESCGSRSIDEYCKFLGGFTWGQKECMTHGRGISRYWK